MAYQLRKTRRIKPKRSLWRSKFLWGGVFIFFIAGAISYFGLISPYFQITDIRISGNQDLEAGDLHNFVAEGISRDIFLFKTKSVALVSPAKLRAGLLEKFPRLAEAKLSRKLPRTIVLDVQERQPAAVWCLQESEEMAFMRCFYIDFNGISFQQVDPDGNMNLPVLRDENPRETPNLGSAVITKDNLDEVLVLEKELSEALHISAREITLMPENRINIITQDGWEIYFELPIELSWQITRLKLLLEKEIPAEKRPGLEYIDMRYSKVYYRYKD